MRRSIAFVMAAILVLFLNAYMVSAQTLFPGGLTQLPPDNPTPNLVLNPGFESVSGGVPASWSTGSGWSADQTVKHSGTYVFMERYVDQAAVEAHRATEHFKTLGRKMGEFMDGRPEILRLKEVE